MCQRVEDVRVNPRRALEVAEIGRRPVVDVSRFSEPIQTNQQQKRLHLDGKESSKHHWVVASSACGG